MGGVELDEAGGEGGGVDLKVEEQGRKWLPRIIKLGLRTY